MSTVSVDDVRLVALLARLAMPEQELTRFTGQLDEILGYVRHLQEVQTDGVEPTSHPLPLCNITRPDQARPSIDPEALLAGAPERHGPYFRVPKVVET